MRILTLARALPALVIIGISWYLSSKPTVEHMPSFWNADKVVHLVCFAFLAFWVAFAFAPWGKKRLRLIVPACFVCLYGIIDEIHQSFVPGRTCSVADWIFDTLGGILGVLAFYAVYTVFLKLHAKGKN